MKKLLIFIMFITLIIPFVNASLQINPSSLNIVLESGVSYQNSINVFNNGNQSLYNVEFNSNPYCTFTDLERIDPNITEQINISCITSSVFSTQNYNQILSGDHLEPISTAPITFDVNLSSSSVLPNIFTIKQGDNVKFTNYDTINHEINSAYFNFIVSPGNAQQTTLNDIGIVYFIDYPTLIVGEITIENNTGLEYVHSSSDDATLTLSISSQHIDTQLSLNMINQYFNISANSETDGILQVTNIGDEPAYGINFVDNLNWITFNNQNFQLSSGNNKNVGYTITPQIDSSEDTNKTYTIDITVSGENVGSVTKQIYVYVPYEEFVIPSNASYEELYDFLQALLPLIEGLEPPDENKTVIVSESVLGLNFTTSEIRDKILRDAGTNQLTLDQIKEIVGNVVLRMEQLENLTATLNNEYLKKEDLENFQKDMDDTIINLFLLALILIIIFVGGPFIRSKIQRKAEEEAMQYE